MSNNLPQFAQAQTEEIPADESALVENLSREIVDRRLTIPALVALELGRPLNAISAEAIDFLIPASGTQAGEPEPKNPTRLEILTRFLKRPDSLQYLSERIETLERLRASEPDQNRTN